ncbi:hypothetical protein EV667_2160 [Ancylobacter aquaticus]|uniref:Uncharacterized protein n=2 Tax=Ancylobacter aquaticus TaxID=100 RepID=A0A4R1I2K4_ANCAQ|nr:hypothetical protein EV667_2160 [Ancylobacter aquaticus]
MIGATAATIAFVALDTERSVGFGTVRETAPAAASALEPALPLRLTRLRAELHIQPAQEAAWGQFKSRIMELDQVSRRIEAQAGGKGADAADEQARHALLFAVALSDMDDVLTTAQASTFNRAARALGSTFICATVRPGGA